MQYKIVFSERWLAAKMPTSEVVRNFEIKIGEMISEGWKPLGGVSISVNVGMGVDIRSHGGSDYMVLMQSMVKD